MWLTLSLIFLSVLLMILKRYLFSKSSTIPEVLGLPILGYYPFLGKNPIATLHQLSNTYGDIFKVNLLGEDYYFLNSFEVVKEAFVNQGDKFMERPVYEFNILSNLYGNKALVHTDLEVYKVQKKFFTSKLSIIGMGKSDFEVRIHELCEDLVKEIERKQTITNLKQLLSNVSLNVIMKLVFDEKYDINDPVYVELLNEAHVIEKSFGDLNMLLVGNIYYWKNRMYFKYWKAFRKSRNAIFNFLLKRIEKRASDKHYQTEFKDILDYCLEEAKGPDGDYFTFRNLAGIFLSFLIAGTETTAGTTHHGITLLAIYPDIQKKIIEEIGMYDKESRISYTDIFNLHYTRAFIAELQRFSCFVPLNLLHISSVATTVNGHFIPKKSKIVANLWKLSRDEKYFKNPNNFDPNNFLDENGNFVNYEAHIPFGIGKRKCIGFKLAEIELFVLITKLVRLFEWCSPHNEPVKYEVIEGSLRHLLPNKLIAKPRL